MMTTLHAKPPSHAFRVLWMLEEIGQECDHVDHQPHDPALSPPGKAPALGDEDLTASIPLPFSIIGSESL